MVNKCKVDPNQTNEDGNKPLISSVYEGHLSIVKYLIEECKADPNQVTEEGDPPLIICAK